MLHLIRYTDRDGFPCERIGEITNQNDMYIWLDHHPIPKEKIKIIRQLPEDKTK